MPTTTTAPIARIIWSESWRIDEAGDFSNPADLDAAITLAAKHAPTNGTYHKTKLMILDPQCPGWSYTLRLDITGDMAAPGQVEEHLRNSEKWLHAEAAKGEASPYYRANEPGFMPGMATAATKALTVLKAARVFHGCELQPRTLSGIDLPL